MKIQNIFKISVLVLANSVGFSSFGQSHNLDFIEVEPSLISIELALDQIGIKYGKKVIYSDNLNPNYFKPDPKSESVFSEIQYRDLVLIKLERVLESAKNQKILVKINLNKNWDDQGLIEFFNPQKGNLKIQAEDFIESYDSFSRRSQSPKTPEELARLLKNAEERIDSYDRPSGDSQPPKAPEELSRLKRKAEELIDSYDNIESRFRALEARLEALEKNKSR